ncbi:MULTISPECIES: polysaccharide deacetylase family protein [unclassified Thiocapsa]|uniref:polysaccharide deacetylase family protein n=1 Tax=unclassified Thiocapsa TaxID=2641286 RepID=UPI0035B02DCD
MSNAESTTRSDAGHIRALVSVHDVMPETLPQVERILTLLDEEGIAPVTLLVVPGVGWSSEGIERLRGFQARGCELAGHGWIHHVEPITGLRHRIHSRFISRNVAEHLALDHAGIQELIARCHAWFVDQGLGAPALYCPPAWAMGPIPRSTLASLPFTGYELFSGVLSAQTGRMHPVPLTGYEADTALRTVVIRAWNRLNRRRAARAGWIRIGIHPYDLDLRLAEDLRRDLRRFRSYAGYSEVGAP